MDNQERRKFVRIKANHLTRHIKFSLPGIDMYPTNETISKDISAGGVLFTSQHPYQVGDVVRMELHIPAIEKPASDIQTKVLPMLALARVMRVNQIGEGKYDIGVAFVGIDDGQQQALAAYINTQEK